MVQADDMSPQGMGAKWDLGCTRRLRLLRFAQPAHEEWIDRCWY
jgi:hypothetical protein